MCANPLSRRECSLNFLENISIYIQYITVCTYIRVCMYEYKHPAVCTRCVCFRNSLQIQMRLHYTDNKRNKNNNENELRKDELYWCGKLNGQSMG